MKLETVIKYTEADASKLNPALLQSEVNSFPIDSREVQAGEVFFALSQPDYKNNCFNGDFADSHVYVPKAFEQGAVACVVRPDRYEEHKAILEPFLDKLLFVDDCILAFQKLAHGVYLEWNKPVIGITGSAGKTTAKELTAHVLDSSKRKVLRNIKNYNNGLGLPITVLNLAKDKTYDVAVLEMGMSTPNNEIARLCKITPPDIAVELCVLPVHIEHLGTIENIQKAKAELVEGMREHGTAVLNADDFRVMEMSLLCDKFVSYGIEKPADVMAKNIEFARFGETKFTLITPNGEAEVLFQLSGNHNIMNALAASSVGHIFGMTAAEIAESLKTVQPPSQRGEVLHFKDFTVVNDSYNSNPDALLSMVKTLVEGGKSAKRKIVIAGAMRELGTDEAEIHYETGKKIAEFEIDALYGVEGLAEKMLAGAKDAGFDNVKFYENSTVAAEEFINEIQAGDLIMVKGSRG
nr:UDP-N-acetylmuramoyl-tripeptide--D-alanyl-D-alanine ligase [Pyrinomonadaceae bacterium]